MGYMPIDKEKMKKTLDQFGKAQVYRTSDMCPFTVTGIGEKVFIIKDRHGVESTRQFSGFWLVWEGVE